MRYSKLFGKTNKSVSSDARAISHKLLIKAGFIRQITAGRYAFLPLGFRVWQKIVNLIQKEMEVIGSERIIAPTLQPIEIWQATNRDQAFGQEMLTVKDHGGATFALGATAEGLMVELVKMFRPSYKDLPIVIHQFSSKFRDEKRPRGGLLRVREFNMKDAYSFCASEKSLLKIYKQFYQAYLRIAKALDLKPIAVEADSGAIGGDYNHEIMIEAEAGEDKIFICRQCGYAANEEKCEFIRDDINLHEKEKPFEIIEQPEWVESMEDNEKHYKVKRNRCLKNVVYKTDKGRLIIAVIRGDLDVNEAKLRSLVKANSIKPATEADLKKIGTKPGYVHSWGHKGVVYAGDLSLRTVKNFIGGQKEKTTDSINVNYGRDFKCKIEGDIALARAGYTCSKCKKGKLEEKRVIEFGHVFKQDLFYTKPHRGYFVDKDGKSKPMWMGAYGIGIGRAMATVVEINHDKDGIIWPKAIAPYQIHLISLDRHKQSVKKEAEKLYQALIDQNLEVLYDDREDVGAGEKLKDADLIGIPYRVVISQKTQKKRQVEIKKRSSKKQEYVTIGELMRLFKAGV